MSPRTHQTERGHNVSDPGHPLLHLFASNDGLWWPYRSFAKALMETQVDASAYLEANRKMMDEIRDIVRKEQDLSLEITSKMIEGAAENGGPRIHDASEVKALFDRAIESVRELGEAWMHAQMRSLDVMRRHAVSNGRKPHAARRDAAE